VGGKSEKGYREDIWGGAIAHRHWNRGWGLAPLFVMPLPENLFEILSKNGTFGWHTF